MMISIKKWIFLFFLLLGSITQSIAQEYFLRYYGNFRPQTQQIGEWLTGTLEIDTNLVAIRNYLYDADTLNFYLKRSSLDFLNSEGDSLRGVQIRIKNKQLTLRKLLKGPQNFYYGFGILFDIEKSFNSNTLNDIFIIKYDEQFNQIWYKEIIPTFNNDEVFDATLTSHNTFLLSGDRRPANNANNDGFVMEIDSSGNIIWDKTLKYPNAYIELPSQSAPIDNTNYVLTSAEKPFGDYDYVIKGEKISPSGQIMLSKDVLPNPNRSYTLKDIYKLENENTIIAIGDINEGVWTASVKNFAVKLDTNFNVLWSTEFGDEPMYANEVVHDGTNFFIAGYEYINGIYKLTISKLNSHGEFMWKTSFSNGGAYRGFHYPLDFMISSKGDLISSGQGFYEGGATKSFGYILKLDSNGCMTTGCNVFVEDMPRPVFSVYPNPTSNMLYFESSNVNIEVVKVYDMLGNLLVEKRYAPFYEQSLDLSDYPDGLYLLQFNDSQESIKIQVLR
jgi:hypothetical protein